MINNFNYFIFHASFPMEWMFSLESISGFGVCVCVCPSSLRRWPLFLLVGFTDPYNHTYSESLWWKLFKNHKRTQIQRQRQWQRQRQRQRHIQSAWKPNICYFFEARSADLVDAAAIANIAQEYQTQRSACPLLAMFQGAGFQNPKWNVAHIATVRYLLFVLLPIWHKLTARNVSQLP